MTLLETYRRTAGTTRLGVPLVDEAVEDGRAAGAALIMKLVGDGKRHLG